MRIKAGRVLTREEARDRIARAWPYESVTCCEDAEIVSCVCRISVRCPTHGLICVGSHD